MDLKSVVQVFRKIIILQTKNYNKYPNQYNSFVCDTWINFFNSAAVYIEGSVRGQWWATIKFSNILPPHCFRGSLARCTAVSPAGSKTLRIETGSLREGGEWGVKGGGGYEVQNDTLSPLCSGRGLFSVSNFLST